MDFSAVRGVVLDMDGVLWRSDDPLPGMTDLFELLGERDLPYALATNNSSKSQADYIAKLERMGIPGVPAERIITSGIATAIYLQGQHASGTRVHVLGGHGLREAIHEAGFMLVDEDAELVVVGLDWDLTYTKLQRAALLIRAGAEFIGTNADTTFPTPQGLSPGAGSILAALEAATDVKPRIIGKPAKPMFEAALKVIGTAAGESLMIGDRLNTDVQGANEAGMLTALVMTGVTTREQLERSDVQPDAVFDDLQQLLAAWG